MKGAIRATYSWDGHLIPPDWTNPGQACIIRDVSFNEEAIVTREATQLLGGEGKVTYHICLGRRLISS
jgi:hypothetical protein